MSNVTQIPAEIITALQNPAVAQLHVQLESMTELSYAPSSDKSWGSTTTPSGTTIDYCACAHPEEAFAHELLHAQLKLTGYRQHLALLAKQPCPLQAQEYIAWILGILDNEFQHHRMMSLFTAMGFSGEFFYDDADASDFKRVRKTVSSMNGNNSVSDFLSQFVTAIAPGGAQTPKERLELKAFIKKQAGPLKANALQKIENIFSQWSTQTSWDHAPALKSVLQLLGIGGCTYWVGASENFPTDGFFVGPNF